MARRWWQAIWLAMSGVAVLGACSSSGSNDDPGVTSRPTPEVSTSSSPTTTSAPTTTTAAPPTTASTTVGPPTTAASSTTVTVLTPGSPCTLGSHPDCIDPDGDGQGTYLLHGAECMASAAEFGNPGICTDLDGDGTAGYPDSG